MLNNKGFGHKTAVDLVIVIFAVVLALLYFTKTTGIPFKSFTGSDVLAIVTSMFIVSVFMERSIEAILTPVRVPDRQKK